MPRPSPAELAEMNAQVEAALAAGKVTVCEADVDGSKAKESTRAYYRTVRAFEREADYTERRMREAENRGSGDAVSERMMLHGE